MSISTAARNQRSAEQFMLVRITPARDVTTTLVSVGGLYTMNWTYPVARVERNGVALTADSSAPGTNDHYYWDETAGTLKIKLAGAPSSTTNVIVVFYYLFYTGAKRREVATTPGASDTTRSWEPRISKYPVFKSGFENTLQGLITYQVTTLELINTDYAFQSYLTNSGSFYQKDILVWLCVDSTTDYQLVFSGKVRSVDFTKTIVRLTMFDEFAKLSVPAYLGLPGSSFALLQAGADPEAFGKPVHAVFGTTSPYTTRKKTGLPSAPVTNHYLQGGLPAYCTSYSSTISAAGNLTWQLGIINATDVPLQSFGSLTRVGDDSGPNDALYLKFASFDKVYPGDTFEFVQAAVTYRTVVLYAGADFTWSGNTYNVVIAWPGVLMTTGGATINPGRSMGVAVTSPSYSGDYQHLLQGYDYTRTMTQIGTSAWYMVTITINAANFNTHFSEYIDPHKWTMVSRLSGAAATHAAAVSTLLTAAGCTVNTASINAAVVASDATVQFTIPAIDSTDVNHYEYYLAELCSSVAGYIAVNASQEVVYNVLAAPSPSETRTADDILDGSMAGSIEYQDIVTGLKFENPHNPAGAIATTPPTASAAAAQYLHGVDTFQTLRHCLELQTNGTVYPRSAAIMAYKSKRRALYYWETALIDATTLPSTDLGFTHAALPSGAANVKVVTTSLDGKTIQVTGSDLYGL